MSLEDYSKQHKKAWKYDAYDFWVRTAGTPQERATKDKENPRKMLKVLIMNQLLIVYSVFKLCGSDAFIAFKHFAKVTGCAEPAFICDVFNCSCGIDQ